MGKVKKVLFFITLLLVFPGCVHSGYNSVEESMQHGNIPYKQIYHQHEIKDGIVIFYESTNGGIDAGIVYKNGDHYEWGFGGGTVPFPAQEDVTWGGVNLNFNANGEEKLRMLYYGILKGLPIARLHIEHNGSYKSIDKDAEIVELSEGNKLWFALQDKHSEILPGFTLTGYNRDGNLIFRFE